MSGDKLVLSFSERLSPGAKADKSAFAVTVAGSSRTVNSYVLWRDTATLTLASPAVTSTQTVTVAYTQPGGSDTKLEDLAGNSVASFAAQTATHTTDITPPSVSSHTAWLTSPSANITLTFSEAVYADASGTAFTSAANLVKLVRARTGETGPQVAFTSTVTSTGTNANKVMTINPSVDLIAETDYYIEVSTAFWDAAGNRATAVRNLHPTVAYHQAIEVDATAPTLVSAVVVGNQMTATFSEQLDSTKKAAESAFSVDIAGTNDDPTVSSYSFPANARLTLSLTLSKAVTEGQSVTLSYTQPSGSNAKLADVASNPVASTSSPIAVTNNTDNTAPALSSFKLGGLTLSSTARSNDTDGNITLTFSDRYSPTAAAPRSRRTAWTTSSR